MSIGWAISEIGFREINWGTYCNSSFAESLLNNVLKHYSGISTDVSWMQLFVSGIIYLDPNYNNAIYSKIVYLMVKWLK